MSAAFDPIVPSTWPLLLTLPQIAAIWQRPEGGIRKQLQKGTFVPAPAERYPYRWRKVDVERYVDGARGALRRVS